MEPPHLNHNIQQFSLPHKWDKLEELILSRQRESVVQGLDCLPLWVPWSIYQHFLYKIDGDATTFQSIHRNLPMLSSSKLKIVNLIILPISTIENC